MLMEKEMTLEEAKTLIKKLRCEIEYLHGEIDEKAYYVGILEEELNAKKVGLWIAGFAFVVTFLTLMIILA